MSDDYTLHDEGTPTTGPRLRISSTKSYSGSTRLIRNQTADHESLLTTQAFVFIGFVWLLVLTLVLVF